ncbi:MAG TPA: leucyl aminopeptidase [Bryobacteraceae bacterium]|jgi:leucyl aminopeptidase|nr:leucyl aminopeptidase [Bryobacteraceae bacterium]
MVIQINVVTAPAEQVTGALGVIVFDAAPDPTIAEQSGWLADLRARTEFAGKLYEIITLHKPQGLAASRLTLIGGGKRETFSPFEARRAAGALVRALKAKAVHNVALLLEGASDELAQAAVEGAILATWEPDKYKTDPKKIEKQIDGFTLVVPGGNQAALEAAAEKGRIIAEAQNLTRDLANEPANRLAPADLVNAARAVAEELGLEIEVLDRDAMTELGMGALLGVAQGSDNPPFLIVLKYRPSLPAGDDHLALVGKGVTFDTGGISIKPADGMEKMKYDMAGAAAAVGAMKAIGRLRPAIPVTAYIPTVENMLNGRAQRPGDIVTSLAGKTIEVLNTDAEGRLILADALTYANRNGATHIIDAATLTGAIGVALGHYNVGAFTNNQPFLDKFLAASRLAGEKTWQLPLEEEYKDYLKSVFADLPNVGGRPGGAITAAWFLREFADPTPWVHLDIAATAWLDDAKPWMSKGPTGVAVRSFVQLATHWQ